MSYCCHRASSVILLHNYVDECKRAQVKKGQKFFFWMFSIFFFIDSIILTCTCVYVLYGRKSKGFVSVYICAIAFQCGIDVLK